MGITTTFAFFVLASRYAKVKAEFDEIQNGGGGGVRRSLLTFLAC